ncbi:YndM family protein [Alicyclobacillus tolerans]|uniref:DUF2512 family protein n=1 Tax=Alicyclobacillus tolerans TaxID=90970 RepID=UPI001F27F24D|nr:DUF2512 family protein [Alicyclobacillus tolerans]MCF8563964.1 YndM family protein [Alicyclobacillus tolerans]
MLLPTNGVAVMNASFKFAGYSAVLLFADTLAPNLYSSLWPVFFTVLVLTAVGTIGDLTILRKFGNLPSLLLGFPGMTFIVWIVPMFWAGTHVSFGSAILVALVILPIEYVLHRYVLTSSPY